MKVLGLTSYPIQAAATRYRLEQFIGPLADQGIVLTVRPFLSAKLFQQFYQRRALLLTGIGLFASTLKRLKEIPGLLNADVVLVQREAAIFGPPILEWLAACFFKRPMVLDLDDATYVSYTSPTYGNLGRKLKWFSKTDDLIRWSRVVTCGNRLIAEYVQSKGALARVIPTVVDTELFRPRLAEDNERPVVGWIGTHSTFPYLENIFPMLQKLAAKHQFRLKIVGAGRDEVSLPGVAVENLEWKLENEIRDFQSLDIGLYPIDPEMYAETWAAGKSGFKAIQYMAVGIPYVASPIGAAAEIGEEGVTHFCARTADEWLERLDSLLTNPGQSKQMGAAGRRHVCDHYSLPAQANKLADALREAVKQ